MLRSTMLYLINTITEWGLSHVVYQLYDDIILYGSITHHHSDMMNNGGQLGVILAVGWPGYSSADGKKSRLDLWFNQVIQMANPA